MRNRGTLADHVEVLWPKPSYSPVADTRHRTLNVTVELAGKVGMVVELGESTKVGVAGQAANPAGVQDTTVQLLKPVLGVS